MSDQNEQRNYADFVPSYAPEPDPYEYRVGFGRRLGAYIIDNIIIELLLLIILFASGQINEISKNAMNAAKSFDFSVLMQSIKEIGPVGAILTLLYFSSELFFGASLGKMMLGIRIGADDRFPASFPQLLTRYLIKNISELLILLSLIITITAIAYLGNLLGMLILIGFFFTLAARRQGFHDMLSATAVFYTNELIENNNQ